MQRRPRTDEEIRRLDDEILRLRTTIFELVPEKAREILGDYILCEHPEAVWTWLKHVTERIVDLAEPRPAAEMGVYKGTGERALCPLCGGGTRGPYMSEGFAWPEGLRRHLLGEQNTHQCGVMFAAQNAALDASKSEFVRRAREMNRKTRRRS